MKKTRIIIIEDEYWVRRSVKRMCEKSPQYDIVETFEFCSDAIEYTNTHPFDLAIIDVTLPDQSGLCAGEKMKTINPDISILYISADEKFQTDAERKGGDGFLLKPFFEKQLFNLLEYITSREKTREAFS